VGESFVKARHGGGQCSATTVHRYLTCSRHPTTHLLPTLVLPVPPGESLLQSPSRQSTSTKPHHGSSGVPVYESHGSFPTVGNVECLQERVHRAFLSRWISRTAAALVNQSFAPNTMDTNHSPSATCRFPADYVWLHCVVSSTENRIAYAARRPLAPRQSGAFEKQRLALTRCLKQRVSLIM